MKNYNSLLVLGIVSISLLIILGVTQSSTQRYDDDDKDHDKDKWNRHDNDDDDKDHDKDKWNRHDNDDDDDKDHDKDKWNRHDNDDDDDKDHDKDKWNRHDNDDDDDKDHDKDKWKWNRHDDNDHDKDKWKWNRHDDNDHHHDHDNFKLTVRLISDEERHISDYKVKVSGDTKSIDGEEFEDDGKSSVKFTLNDVDNKEKVCITNKRTDDETCKKFNTDGDEGTVKFDIG